MYDLNCCTHCWNVALRADDGLCSDCYTAAEARLELDMHENDASEECTRRMEGVATYADSKP